MVLQLKENFDLFSALRTAWVFGKEIICNISNDQLYYICVQNGMEALILEYSILPESIFPMKNQDMNRVISENGNNSTRYRGTRVKQNSKT